MNRRASRWQEAASFAAGVLIGASIVTPVFAATSDIPAEWQPFILIGSIVLLVVALTLRALGTRPARHAPLRSSLGAIRRLRPVAFLPVAIDEHRGDRQLVDHSLSFFFAVDPVEILRIVVAIGERLYWQHPVARVLLRVKRLPFGFAQQYAGHVAFAPGAGLRRRLVALDVVFTVVEQRLEPRRRLAQRARDAVLHAQDERQDAACLLVVGEHGRYAPLAVAPHNGQPFRGLDQLRSADDRRKKTVEHLQVHAVLRYAVRRQKRL